MLQTAQIAAVRAVAAAAPDTALEKLENALRAGGSTGATALVHDLIEAELSERQARNAVFAPLMPLCARPRHSVGVQLFPSQTPARLWAALKVAASEETQAILAGAPADPAIQNRLCLRAAASLRTGEGGFAPVVDGLHASKTSQLALALELAPIARATLLELPTWFGRSTGAHVAAMRLAYRDAARLGDGAGPLLMEMLLGAMDEPWRILQLIGWIMDRPEERFVAESELAGLALRLIDSIDVAVQAVKGAEFDRGSDAGVEAARALERGLATVIAVEGAFALKRGPWADQVRRHRGALTGSAEARLREAEAVVGSILPPPPLKLAGRTIGGGSRFTAAPDPAVMRKGRALLAFLSETHHAADDGGFGGLWVRTAKAVDDRLSAAADELVGMLRGGLGDAAPLQGCLEAAAELTTVMQGSQAGGLVRRRAAVI